MARFFVSRFSFLEDEPALDRIIDIDKFNIKAMLLC